MLQPKIMSVEPQENYHLLLSFATGEVKRFDVAPYLSGSWFGQLRDPKYFRTVHTVPDGSGIEWADGQDIAPHELYEVSYAV